MKKHLTTIILLLGFVAHVLHGQSFVNSSNKWLLDDCCYAIGETSCHTYECYFGGIVTIDNREYRTLITNNTSPLFDLGKFYRESEGKVYMKMNLMEPEVLIYDFTLQPGDPLEINNQTLTALSVDSITLNSGERRKRIELGDASNLYPTTYWIEGMGSLLSPLNTQYMFSLDCWNNLNCYHIDSLVQYQIGNCALTASKELILPDNHFSVSPNPVRNQLFLHTDNEQWIISIEIINPVGELCLKIENFGIKDIYLGQLPSGVYWVKARFQNGRMGYSKIIKYGH